MAAPRTRPTGLHHSFTTLEIRRADEQVDGLIANHGQGSWQPRQVGEFAAALCKQLMPSRNRQFGLT